MNFSEEELEILKNILKARPELVVKIINKLQLTDDDKEIICDYLYMEGEKLTDIKIFKIGSKFNCPDCDQQLGNIYSYKKNYKEATFYYKKVIESGCGIGVSKVKEMYIATKDDFWKDHFNSFDYSDDIFLKWSGIKQEDYDLDDIN